MAQQIPNSFPQLTLDNGEVQMQLYLPDPERGSYRATRFDWSGIIHHLEYKGHTYFGYWKKTHDPLVHEDLSGPVEGYLTPGLGYEEAKPGQEFIRIGVGALEREEEPKYQAFKTYRILDHGKWKVQHGKDWIRFRHRVSIPSGYAYEYTKTIRLTSAPAGFVMEHQLKNTGSKVIETDQFNHNFFILDGAETGPDIDVVFPFALRTSDDLKDLAQLDGGRLQFLKLFKDTFVWMQLAGYGDTPADHSFTVSNRRTGAAVRVRVDQPLHRLDFWACQTTYCPENYVYIKVTPGDTFRWTSTYELMAP